MISLDNNTPEYIARNIQQVLEQYRARAELAEEYALKTKEEIERLVDKRIKEYEYQYIKQIRLSFGCFQHEEECDKWSDFLNTHYETCYPPRKRKYELLPYVMPYFNNHKRGYIARCPACGAEQDITYKEDT